MDHDLNSMHTTKLLCKSPWKEDLTRRSQIILSEIESMDSSIILDLFSTKNDLYIGKDLVSDHELNNNWDYRIYAEDC